MDILTLIGIVLSFGAIIGGNLLEGGHTGSLVQMTAFIIVMGGTVGAILVQTPMAIFRRALIMSRWVIKPPVLPAEESIGKITNWSQVARREGLLGLEAMSQEEADPFAAKGLQLLVDGTEPEALRTILEVELDTHERRDYQAARVFEGMGGYCPTIGILGAVMGLIHVMNNLGDPSKLGSGIAVAFVATIYGVGLANLVFLPVANKLKLQIARITRYREMMIEGLLSIAAGENPRAIETKLRGFVA